MPRLATLGLLAAAAIPLLGCATTEHAATEVKAAAQAQATPTLSTADAAFMDQAGRAGIEEVTFGQLARTQASRASTRDFALRMIDQHTKVNQELTQLATRKQITPTTSMDTAHQDMYDQLQKLHGRAFDRAYLNGQVADHQTVIELFQNEAVNGTDADVKAFAARTLPQLKMHLQMAEKLGGKAPAPAAS